MISTDNQNLRAKSFYLGHDKNNKTVTRVYVERLGFTYLS